MNSEINSEMNSKVSTEMSSILSIKNVNQIFRTGFMMTKTQILFDVNLEIPERSIFGFIGPNGAGKTTLIHILIGLRRAASGTATLGGFDVSTKEARAQLGYLPERPYFHDFLTGRGFLEYMGTLSQMSSDKLKKRIPEVLGVVGLSHVENLELKKFSKGMLQRIGIAQAILHEPKLLILDEPMSGLDPLGRKEMRDLILKLASEGKTIFFTSHVIPDVEAICDRVAIIHRGKIREQGQIAEFLSHEKTRYEIDCGALSGQVGQPPSYGQIESRKTPDGIRLLFDSNESSQMALKKLVQENIPIFSFHAVRPSLETLFQAEVKGGTK